MRQFKLFLAVLVFVVLAFFIVGNAQPVRLQFVTLHTGELPLFVVIAGAFLLGFIAGWIWTALGRTRRGGTGRPQPPPGAAGSSTTSSPGSLER